MMGDVGPGKPPVEHRFQPGVSGNPAGKPKGTKHLSTLIQELTDGIDWELTSLKNKEELAKKYGKNGIKALVMVAYSKALSGDTKAMDWLAKYGWGNKVTHDFEDSFFTDTQLTIKVVKAKHGDDNTERQAGDSVGSS